MSIHGLSSLSKDLDKWMFWKSDRQEHYGHVRANAYEIIAQQNFLIKDPSREQLELEMKFFKKLKSKIGNRSNVQQADYELGQLENGIAEYDRKVSKFVNKARAASGADYMLMLRQAAVYGPDRDFLEQHLIHTQTNLLDLLLASEALTDLAAYKKQRDIVFERLQYCRKLSGEVASINQRLTFDSLASIRAQYRIPGLYQAGQLLGSAGSAVSLITHNVGALVSDSKDVFSIRGIAATVGIVAGLGTAIAYNQISFDQVKIIGILSGMVATGYFGKHLENPQQT